MHVSLHVYPGSSTNAFRLLSREHLLQRFLEDADIVINQCLSFCWAVIAQYADEAEVPRTLSVSFLIVGFWIASVQRTGALLSSTSSCPSSPM
jgi:hypothetical protein